MILNTRLATFRRFFLPLAAGLAGVVLARAADEAPALPTSGLTALTAANTPLKAGMKIAFFGDSITMQGYYIDAIQKALSEAPATKDLKVEITRHGLNGGRVPTVLEGKSPWGNLGGTMQELVDKDKPNVLVIFLGVNDVWHKEKGTNPADFRAGLKKMVDMGVAAKAKVVLVTPVCIEERPDGKNPFDKNLDKYARIVADVAKDTHSGFADVRTAAMEYLKKANVKDGPKGEFKKKGILTADGVHLHGPGNALVADHVAQAIVDALK